MRPTLYLQTHLQKENPSLGWTYIIYLEHFDHHQTHTNTTPRDVLKSALGNAACSTQITAETEPAGAAEGG